MGSLCGELRKTQVVHIITPHVPDAADEEGVYRAPWHGLLAFAVYGVWRGAMILARERQIPVVFGGSALVTPLVLILARLFRRRAVVLTHGLDVIHQNCFYQSLCVRWLKFCDKVVANSNYTAALVKSKGIAQTRLAVISPGVDVERFSSSTDVIATKRYWNIEGKRIILFVGRLAKRKGIKEFIEKSLVEIVREIPETVFLIVGENPTEALAHRGDVLGEIKLAGARLGLSGQVRTLGALNDDEIVKLYHACDVVVLPALDVQGDVEGFGIIALEAAAAGKPVVATRVGGIPDAVDGGKSGILVEPGDYESLTRIVTALLMNIETCASLGQYGRYRAKQIFSWHCVVGSYKGLLADLRSPSTIR